MPSIVTRYGCSIRLRRLPASCSDSNMTPSSAEPSACGTQRGMTDPYQIVKTRQKLASADV